MHTGYPIFPGESEIEQMQCIMEVLGVPSHAILEKSTRGKLFFDNSGTPKIAPNSRGKVRYPGRKNLKDVLKGADYGLIDLISSCLEWDPSKRITPEEALNHSWMIDNSQKLNNSNSRGGSAQPNQGISPKHYKKLSDTIIKPTLHRLNRKSLNVFN